MPTNLRGAILKTHSIEAISLAYTLGVFIGQFFTANYYLLFLLAIPFIIYKREELAGIFVCGLFSYALFSLAGINFEIPSFITECSDKICDYIDTLPLSHTDLMKALLQGDKSGLSKDIVSVFRNAGAAHLLALSGLHMGIIYWCATGICKPLPIKVRSTILIVFALFFCLMTGARPSIVRAFLFIVIREASIFTGHKLPLIKTLFLALLIQLIICPTIITSIGFQLSYSAVLGIALLYPFLESCLDKDSNLHVIWDPLSITISAQLFTTPLSVYYFNSFPKHFLIANFMVIPLTTIFMVLSILIIALSYVGICPTLLYSQLDDLGDVIIFILQTINSF